MVYKAKVSTVTQEPAEFVNLSVKEAQETKINAVTVEKKFEKPAKQTKQ